LFCFVLFVCLMLAFYNFQLLGLRTQPPLNHDISFVWIRNDSFSWSCFWARS
jgi:hypothetical protein